MGIACPVRLKSQVGTPAIQSVCWEMFALFNGGCLQISLRAIKYAFPELPVFAHVLSMVSEIVSLKKIWFININETNEH